MTGWLGFLLPPAAALVIARLGRREKRPAILDVGQGCLYAFLILAVVSIAMLPADRAAMRVFWDGHGGAYLYVQYGQMAMLLAGVLGVALGLVSRAAGARLGMAARVTAREKRRVTPGLVVVHALVLALLMLTFSFIWGLCNYGNVTFEEMVFHLNMPLEGTSKDLVADYLRRTLSRSALAFAMFELLVWWPSARAYRVESTRCRAVWAQVFPLRLPLWAALTGLALWLAILLAGADQCFTIGEYIRNQIHQSGFIEENYADPRTTAVVFPQEKRNLITIYLESMETSAQDRANGGVFDDNYIPELTRLAKENVSFSQSGLVEGAAVAPACGWTIAGLVAQTAGLPLKLYAYDDESGGIDNALGDYGAFMPGATTMGDILRGEGYRCVFMAGSDFTFGGRRAYYAQHGDYEILDYHIARERGVIDPDYWENWGFEDQRLYAWAKEELTALAASGQPFHFAMLTVDTHSPNGYTCPLCPDLYAHEYANVLACSSAQLDAFISWCQEQPFYENTTIVVTGDHASMAPAFYGDSGLNYNKHDGGTGRWVYNAFINSAAEPVRETGWLFTTMDFFPTTLASLGVTIEGERLGLGTNLFSDRETLAEEYGYETMFDEMSRKSVFYNREILYP